MLADPLTKCHPGDYLRYVMECGRWSIVEEGWRFNAKRLKGVRSLSQSTLWLFRNLDCDRCLFCLPYSETTSSAQDQTSTTLPHPWLKAADGKRAAVSEGTTVDTFDTRESLLYE